LNVGTIRKIGWGAAGGKHAGSFRAGKTGSWRRTFDVGWNARRRAFYFAQTDGHHPQIFAADFQDVTLQAGILLQAKKPIEAERGIRWLPMSMRMGGATPPANESTQGTHETFFSLTGRWCEGVPSWH